MPIETISFFECLEKAHDGRYQLPVFQRPWKWQRKKVIALFDSLRSEYPIGTILTANAKAFSSSAPIQFGANEKDLKEPELLVLDGQQRITSGLQLFFGNAPTQKTHYFIDVGNIKKLHDNWRQENPNSKLTQVDLDHFGNSLEPDDGYLVARPRSGNPHSLFTGNGKIFTPLLAPWNTTQWVAERERYLDQFPNDKEFIDWIYHFFQGSKLNPQMPNIIIPENDHRVLSRIFSTLNNSGLRLTSFELAVSEMFGQGIDIKKEIDAEANKLKYYPNVDPTNEIVLQTVILFDGGDPKKANLSKNLNKENWQKHKDDAFKCLEAVGQFLDENMGFALRTSNSFVPYDSLFLPLAFLWKEQNPNAIRNSSKRRKAFDIIKKYVVSACLHTRFTEGAFTKQKLDAKALVRALETLEEKELEETLFEPYSGLHLASPKGGAVGKIVLCLLNANGLKDPLSGKKIDLNDNSLHLHHLWPTDFVERLPNSSKDTTGNLISNITVVTQETNSEFSNIDPKHQLEKIENSRGEETMSLMGSQFVDEAAIAIMKKDKKNAEDFRNFVNIRVETLARMISEKYDLEYLGAMSPEDEKLDLDEDY